MRRKNIGRQRILEKKIYRKRAKRRIYLRIKNQLANRPKEKYKRVRRPLVEYRPIPPPHLSLPRNFSFINNPIIVLKFFAKFRNYAHEGTNVILDFRPVETITPDVIPLLLAKVSKYIRQIRISVIRTQQDDIDKLLLESGFYKVVGLINYISKQGLLGTHKSTLVNTEIAVDARKLTAEKTFGAPDKRIQPLYRTLIECMANTRKHASTVPQYERWWLSVYNDPITKVTSFAFCDTGIGIFKSTRLQNITKFALKVGLKKNSDILKSILEGKIASSTGLSYRGKGLPKIYSDYKGKYLKKLCIAANDTFADFDAGTFIELADELNGTFLYWEISPN